MRHVERETIPVCLGAIGPRMLELVGRKATAGSATWPPPWIGYLATAELVRDHVRPTITAGAEAAGRDASAVDIMLELICVISDDAELAMQRARKRVGFYAVPWVGCWPATTRWLPRPRRSPPSG
ncbi:MAG: LLM class flavin-dependent oxidoreductase [Pseudonocardia sp.]